MRLPDRQTLLPFLRWLPGTSRKTLGNDLLVGLTGAILALPQSLAYALIAGLPAEYGLYAAIVPVIVASDRASHRASDRASDAPRQRTSAQDAGGGG